MGRWKLVCLSFVDISVKLPCIPGINLCCLFKGIRFLCTTESHAKVFPDFHIMHSRTDWPTFFITVEFLFSCVVIQSQDVCLCFLRALRNRQSNYKDCSYNVTILLYLVSAVLIPSLYCYLYFFFLFSLLLLLENYLFTDFQKNKL